MGYRDLRLKNSGGNSLPSFRAFCSMRANSSGDGFFTVESGEIVRSTTFIGGYGGDHGGSGVLLRGWTVELFHMICTALSGDWELAVDDETSSSAEGCECTEGAD